MSQEFEQLEEQRFADDPPEGYEYTNDGMIRTDGSPLQMEELETTAPPVPLEEAECLGGPLPPTGDEAELRREDTGEVIESRQLTEDERQLHLDMQEEQGGEQLELTSVSAEPRQTDELRCNACGWVWQVVMWLHTVPPGARCEQCQSEAISLHWSEEPGPEDSDPGAILEDEEDQEDELDDEDDQDELEEEDDTDD